MKVWKLLLVAMVVGCGTYRVHAQVPTSNAPAALVALGIDPDASMMDELCRATHPEWSDSQRDSARAAWQQWRLNGPPRDAEALAFLWPDQQFALERYQAQFGWPRDSTE